MLNFFSASFYFHTWMAGLGGVRERGDAGGGRIYWIGDEDKDKRLIFCVSFLA